MSDPTHIYDDASLGVGAGRSRIGALVNGRQHVIAWRSCRESITVWSAVEAEVGNGHQGARNAREAHNAQAGCDLV